MQSEESIREGSERTLQAIEQIKDAIEGLAPVLTNIERYGELVQKLDKLEALHRYQTSILS